MKNENERFVEMGKRIKARRVSLGMKQMELAERIDISNNHISSIERGIERPGLESFIRICDVLDVTPDYLLLGSMKANDIPKNITDNLKLCTDEEVQFCFTKDCCELRNCIWNIFVADTKTCSTCRNWVFAVSFWEVY